MGDNKRGQQQMSLKNSENIPDTVTLSFQQLPFRIRFFLHDKLHSSSKEVVKFF
jgi:hypothetical protein